MSATLEAGLAKAAPRVISHMNADHAPSLLAWAHYYAALPSAVAAELSA